MLLSDGGLTDEEQKLLPPGTRYERIGATAANRSVERVDVEPRGSGLHARVTLRNHGDSAVTQQLRFDVDGVTAATQRVTIPAAQPLTVEVDLPARRAGGGVARMAVTSSLPTTSAWPSPTGARIARC
ncbi:MAG: hypothetical protein V9E89_11860 [Ilumatobacteraceae bacterium]